MKDKTLVARYLTYAGTVPFLFTGIGQFFADELFGLNLQHLAMTYGAVIVSFIAGIHWGVYLFKETPMNLFIHSNVVALLSWSALLVPPFAGYFILISSFVYLILIDLKLRKLEIIESWFIQIRVQATSLAILTLLLGVIKVAM